MNLQALEEIINNNVEIIEEAANDNNADKDVVIGIAKFAVINGFDKLSDPQKYHFNNCIRHLIEDVQCPGYNHEFEEVPTECPNILDEDQLVEYYQNITEYCEQCEAQASDDAYRKAAFFRD